MNTIHSVRLLEDQCRGCTACLKRCPVEAIRVYDSKAHILHERCIDCGECIRACPHQAKVAHTNSLEDLSAFAYTVALPAPSLYGQFRQGAHIARLRDALLALGFSMVYDVAQGADQVARALRAHLRTADYPRPLISSACPVVTRLIQARFPALIAHLAPFRQPMEAAAAMAREQAKKRFLASDEQIGVFFITPCPAKMTAIRHPLGHERSQVDGALSMLDVYALLQPHMSGQNGGSQTAPFSEQGLNWAVSGGELAALRPLSSICVDGIDQVIQVLEEVEDGRIDGLDYIEALACPGGCIGGPLVYENHHLARNTLDKLRQEIAGRDSALVEGAQSEVCLRADLPIPPNDCLRLHESIAGAMERMEEMLRLKDSLPGYDCGSCGSPTCASFAEDIVRGLFQETDCIYVLKGTLQEMAQSMVDLAKTRRE